VDLNDALLAPGFRADPYPVYRMLREQQPIFPALTFTGAYLLTRFADCEAVLRDPRWSAARSRLRRAPEVDGEPAGRAPTPGSNGTRSLNFTDPPEHSRVRRLMARAFTPRAVESLRPRVQELVDGVLDRAAERGELDVMDDLARTLPVMTICHLLGVPEADRPRFTPWSTDATRTFDGVLDADTASRARGGWRSLLEYIDELIDDHRAAPRDDLLSAFIAAEEAGDRLTHDELRINAVGLLVAGHETTANLIGNGTSALLTHRDQLRRWHDDPSLTATAVEELLRFDSMVQLVVRGATEDVEVGGHRFRAGDHAILLLGAANRDPARFDDPDRLDLGRDDGPHLTFGHGIHYCLGAALARLQGGVALGSVVRRFPQAEAVGGELRHRPHFVLRGLRELRVAV